MTEKEKVIRDLWYSGVASGVGISKSTGIPVRTVNRIIRNLQLRGKPIVKGPMPEDEPDGLSVLDGMISQQREVEDEIDARYSAEIVIPDDRPVALVPFGDLHLGNKYTDYKQLREDTEIVQTTDGMYGIGTGDYHDNWIGFLRHLQREMPIPFNKELALLDWWFESLEGKLLAVVGGNHDVGRTKKLAGIDHIKRMLRGAQLLYDPDVICFTLKLGEASWRFKVRHSWPGHSQFNDTHGIEKDPKFGDGAFDVGIGSHTHRGTLFRDFNFHGKKRLAVLTGTYKMDDRFGLEMGMPRATGAPTGALVLTPSGDVEAFRSLSNAATFLQLLRQEHRP
jgi:hypothetical protein